EVAVAAFLEGHITLDGIYRAITDALSHIPFVQAPTLDDYVQTHHATIGYTLDSLSRTSH
ncbi:MAG: hypothetical protein K2H83_09435, partial [Duncaniella sp.]|nr:hypothetical protein [Duncaniella sp.]